MIGLQEVKGCKRQYVVLLESVISFCKHLCKEHKYSILDYILLAKRTLKLLVSNL